MYNFVLSECNRVKVPEVEFVKKIDPDEVVMKDWGMKKSEMAWAL